MIRKVIPTALLLLLALAASAGALPPGPYLTTGAADQITDTSARVVVYVNGNQEGTDIPSQCWIDYGTTTAYGSRVSIPCAGTAYQTLTALTPGTTYYYQLGACNTDGAGHSPTYKSFKTDGTTSDSTGPGPGGTDNPCSPGGNPVPPPPPSYQASLAVAKSQRISTAARKGVRLRLGLPSTCACTVSASLTVSKQTARRLHLPSRRIGSAKRTGLLGKATVTVRLKKAAAKRLQRSRRAVAVVAAASVADAQGHTSAVSRKLKLRR